ncbi:MAG: xanthine dehydrogenase [Ramlibacter sp.]|nr:xanthine dehydrogenase [Ramlibacter sp.]
MKMDQPAAHNALDDNREGQVGSPIDRVDARLKVTGQAPYAYEVREAPEAPAYGWIVESPVAKGRIAEIDTREAERAPGVLLVLTHHNAPPQAHYVTDDSQRFERPMGYLDDDKVEAYGEPVALVVAQTLEAARAASLLVQVRIDAEPAEFDWPGHLQDTHKPSPSEGEPDSGAGDFEQGFAQAAVKLDATYTTPFHIHAQMEPHATVAWWEGDKVVVHCSTQMVEHAQKRVANTLKMPVENVRIVSRYIGGGFGGKLPVYADVILSAIASRQLGRPVKTALTRQQMFHITTHRTPTVQRVRLGAQPDGKLLAVGHEVWCHAARGDDFFEPAAQATRNLYATPNLMTRHRVRELDLPRADSCRAPGEAVGLLALESAMDELAHELGIDPVELRLRNEPELDPEKHIPYSTRQLVACLRQGADRFGWHRRVAEPAQVREGRWQIGMGMCAASRGNHLMKAKAKVSLQADGTLEVRTAMTDIGTGTYTILTQIAAETTGVAPAKVRVLLGDSDFPPSSGSGGSFGAASSGSAVLLACENLRLMMDRGLKGPIEAEGAIEPGEMDSKYSQQSYGAQFAEVAVDAVTGEVRLRRMLGVFAAGRILNPKTARSQAIGGMIWGVSSALHEEGALDQRHGFFANHDLAEYHVSAHADIPRIEAIFLPEVDDKANPLKIKGVGELGISGAGAAVANAIFNATGRRVRDFPITLDKVLGL